MRVLFAGDTHANVAFLRRVYVEAEAAKVEAIIQLGDFGFWPGRPFGDRFLGAASDCVDRIGIPLYFVDGNHEDHEALDHLADEPVEVVDGVTWLPRGVVSTFGSSRVLSYGGAVSVDQHLRTPGHDWFSDEVPSLEQQRRAVEAPQVDVIVAHDIPLGVELSLTYPVTEQIDRQCANHRAFCRSLYNLHQPMLWLGGHYHQRVTEVVGQGVVEVLAHDYAPVETTYLVRDL
jgi:hypothetical protein